MIVTVFSVSLTSTHVAVVLRELIVETGISLMDLCYDFLEMFLKFVELRELIYVVVFHQVMVYTAVLYQLMWSMTIMISL